MYNCAAAKSRPNLVKQCPAIRRGARRERDLGPFPFWSPGALHPTGTFDWPSSPPPPGTFNWSSGPPFGPRQVQIDGAMIIIIIRYLRPVDAPNTILGRTGPGAATGKTYVPLKWFNSFPSILPIPSHRSSALSPVYVPSTRESRLKSDAHTLVERNAEMGRKINKSAILLRRKRIFIFQLGYRRV